MKYIYTGGPYREFRGRVFVNGAPVLIDDQATVDAIERQPDFRRVDEKVEEAKTEAVLVAAENEPAPVANACPKCGRALHAKGAHFHLRACKG